MNEVRQIIETTWGHYPGFRHKSGDEYCMPCPLCGGDDRFFMNGYKGIISGHCRQCGHKEYADDPSPQTKERIVQRQQKEEDEFEDRLAQFQGSRMWEQYHDSMDDSQRNAWKREGISYQDQDRYQLGYIPDKRIWNPKTGKWAFVDVMTIPGWHYEKQVRTLQYRLLNFPEGLDKYHNMAGFPTSLFFADPTQPITERIVVVEGAKKAIVVQGAMNRAHYEGHCIAFPSKNPSKALIRELSAADELIMALDPDAMEPDKRGNSDVKRIVKEINGPKIKAANFPVKPDDLIVLYNQSADDLVRYLYLSRVIKLAK